ncbi:MAG TPA: DASS family sodium-coupled anion symporter [Terriglobales bacterium]|nr:DASS family sodium-coupled anion symporter [Terriglobales bacterium]
MATIAPPPAKPKLDKTCPSVIWRWAIVLIPGLLLYFLPLTNLNSGQRHLLAVFVATVIALVAHPVPMGVSTLVTLALLALTRTLTPSQIYAGYSNTTVWLIFTAFLFSRAVISTGFGMRVAYLFIRSFGHNSLTLGYSVAASDAVLAPFIPSDTARGGGIVYPIVQSIAKALGSEPGGRRNELGAFLILIGFHTTYVASAMFLTGMASNPLIADFARQIAHIDLTWLRWAIGASVPGVAALVIVPWFLYRVHPPGVRDTGQARILARDQLIKMGRTSRNERWLIAVLLLVIAGWITSPWHRMPNAIVALAGLCTLLVSGVVSWEDLLSERKAWDALIWFGALIGMADALQQAGIVDVLSRAAFHRIQGWFWLTALVVLMLLYLYIHYSFASMTAQVTALYPAFLAAALASGVHPLLAALPLAYFSNLNAGITHFGTGSAAVYFGGGYVSQGTWWKIGFLVSLVNLVLWLGLGLLWWRVLGWW